MGFYNIILILELENSIRLGRFIRSMIGNRVSGKTATLGDVNSFDKNAMREFSCVFSKFTTSYTVVGISRYVGVYNLIIQYISYQFN